MYSHEHSSAVQQLLRKEITRLPVYDPGADPNAVLLEYGLECVIKLSNNENPYGISPIAAHAIQKLLAQGIGRYPDPVGKELSVRLAEMHAVAPRRIVLGNGSENILELLCQAFLCAGDVAITQLPCFGLHEIFPLMMGARVIKVPLTASFQFNAQAWRDALSRAAKLIFISQPSNPAGTAFSRDELESIIHGCAPDCLLVVDEAYYEYAKANPDYPDALEVLRAQDRPWIVLRTFSKAYGLASVRVGYGVASHANLVDALHRIRTPYNVNQLAQVAAMAALEDTAHLEKSVALVVRERDRLTAVLRGMGLRVAPSLANFLFIDTGTDALSVVQKLLRKGVIVKAWREPGYQTFIRASLALPAENDVFINVLTHVLRAA